MKYIKIALILALLCVPLAQAAIQDNIYRHFSLDELTGSIAKDYSLNKINATINGSVVLGVSGKIGTAFNNFSALKFVWLNGTTYTTGNNFSVNAWILWDNVTGERYAWSDDYSVGGRGRAFGFVNKQFTLANFAGGASASGNWLNSTPLGWHMITATYRNNVGAHNLTLYFDGVEVISTTSAVAWATETQPSHIGNRPYVGTESPFNSSIDEVTLWNKVLTPSEITTIYNGGSGISMSDYIGVDINFSAKDLDIGNATVNRFNVTLNGSSNYFNSTTTGAIMIYGITNTLYNVTCQGRYSLDPSYYYNVNFSTLTNFTCYFNETKAYVNFTGLIGTNTSANSLITRGLNLSIRNNYNDTGSNNYIVNNAQGWQVVGLPIYNMSNNNPQSYSLNYSSNYTYCGQVVIASSCNRSSVSYTFNQTVNAYFWDVNLTVQAKNLTTQISNFNITLTGTIINKSYTTTNGNITESTTGLRLMNYENYTLYFTSAGLSPQTVSLNSPVSGTYNYTIITTSAGTINITIVDEVSNATITQNMTIVATNDNYSTTVYTTTGNYLLTVGSDGEYKIRISNANYSYREYYVNILGGQSVNLIARLALSTISGGYNFYIRNVNKNDIEGGYITVQRNYGGSYVTITQCKSNILGLCQITAINGQDYRIIASATGFSTVTSLMAMVPEVNNSIIFLTPTGSDPYILSYYGATFAITPGDNLIMLNGTYLYNFSITTYPNPGNSMLYTWISYGDTIVNVTGSPSGATATILLDLSNVSTSTYFDVSYGYMTTASLAVPVNLTRHYYAYNGSFYPSTIGGAIQAWGGDFNPIWKAIAATFVIIIMVILGMSLTGVPIVAVVSGIGTSVLFASYGWLPAVWVGVIGVLTITTFLFTSRG